MKLSKDRKKIMFMLKKINALSKLDKELNDKFEPFKKYPDANEAWWFLDYYSVLSIVYLEMVGEDEKEVYKRFKCTKYDKPDLPVGWYTTRFNQEGDGSLPGPEGYSGFICDRINDVILSNKLTASVKYDLLTTMFGDLIRLEQIHKKRTKSKKR